MPDMIKQGVLCFTDPRERDVFFTGALSILSACIPHIIGEYNRHLCIQISFLLLLLLLLQERG
ncbi:MAG: hypothetical protein COW63_16720, partial [Bacteroidetes bacterium CG18_big_fil_WC_8_21_14_2_50_41_14]